MRNKQERDLVSIPSCTIDALLQGNSTKAQVAIPTRENSTSPEGSDSIASEPNTHRNVPRPAIPMPAFDVPYAAPTVLKTIWNRGARRQSSVWSCKGRSLQRLSLLRSYPRAISRENAVRLQPFNSCTSGTTYPKNGAHGGHSSFAVDILVLCLPGD